MILIAKISSFVLRSMLSSKMRPSPRTTGRKVVCKLYQRFGQINVGNLAGIPCCTSGTEPSTNNAGMDSAKLISRSSNKARSKRKTAGGVEIVEMALKIHTDKAAKGEEASRYGNIKSRIEKRCDDSNNSGDENMFSDAIPADSGDAKNPVDDEESVGNQQRQTPKSLVVLIDMTSRNNTSSEGLQG